MAQSNLPKTRLAYLQSILDCTRDALFVTEIDRSGSAGHQICFVNDAFTRMTGFSLADATGKSPTFLCGPETDVLMTNRLAAAFERSEKSHLVLLNYRKDGGSFRNEYFVNPLLENEKCRYVIAIQQAVRADTERMEKPESLEAQFQSLTDNLSEAILIHQGKQPLFVNAAYVELFGYSSNGEALREISPLMNLPLDDIHPGQQIQCEALRADGSPLNLTLRSSTTTWHGSQAMLLTISRSQQPASSRGSKTPISMTAPGAGSDNTTLMREFLDALPVILAHKTRNLQYTYVNKTYADWVGCSREQIVGHHVSDVRNEAHYQLMKPRREEVLSGKVVHYITKCKYPGRGMCDLYTTLIPRRDPDGAINGYFSMVQDITDLKEIERELTRREEQLRLVMDSVPALIAYRDRNLCYRYVNRPYAEWHGVRRDDMIGCYMTDFIELSVFREIKPHLDRVLAGERFRHTYKFVGGNQGERSIAVDYVPHEDENGHIVGFFTLGQDLTPSDGRYDQTASRIRQSPTTVGAL